MSAHADLVLVNAKVITVDPRFSLARAVAARGGRIAMVGEDAQVRALVGPDTRVVDAGGRAVMPGLVDGHAHMDREGLKALLPSLAGCASIDDVLQRIEVLVRESEPGRWIVTMPLGDPPQYWDVPQNLRERRFPDRRDLDRVSPRNPVYIRAIWGYWRHTLPLVSVANSRALEAAGITRETQPPCAAVEIDKDSASGEPTGIFIERTYVPIVELVLMPEATRFTHADRVRGLAGSQRIYNAAGTTTVFEGHGVAAEVLRVYREVWERGGLTVRSHLVTSPWWSPPAGTSFDAVLGSWGAGLAGRGLGDEWLRVAGLHAEADPPPEDAIRARAMPYTGWAGFGYGAGLPRAQVKTMLLAAARHGIRVVSAGTGLLDLYEEVDREMPIRDLRWVIAHVSLVRPDEIRRMRDLGVVVTTHTNRYIYKEGALLRSRAAEGEDMVVPLRSLVEAGVHTALATDNVPPSLWHPVWHAVARVDRTTGDVVGPAQRLSREAALRAATIEGAWLSFQEREQGSIEPGKRADLVVLSEDPLTVPEERLPGIVADLTVAGGRVVYERADPTSQIGVRS